MYSYLILILEREKERRREERREEDLLDRILILEKHLRELLLVRSDRSPSRGDYFALGSG